MQFPQSRTTVYVYSEPCDMRKGIAGLSGIVRNELTLDPLSGHCFFFINRRRNQVKLLYWERTGYCIWMKKLTKGTFPALRSGALTPAELGALLEGAKRSDLEHTRSKRYEV